MARIRQWNPKAGRQKREEAFITRVEKFYREKGVKLTCILDTCPKDSEFVNHLKCNRCDYNKLGEQPEFGSQQCTHPEAEHKPNHQRWQDMKACGPGILAVRMTRGY